MNLVRSMQVITKGSVRMVNGEFFTPNWVGIFTPADQHQARLFLTKVSKMEQRLNRRLTRAELNNIVNEVENE